MTNAANNGNENSYSNGDHHPNAGATPSERILNGNSSCADDDDDSYYYYLSPSAAQGLLQFQYRGQDRSLLYKYVLSPVAEFLVQTITPRWLAPNTITLVGLLFMISSYLISWYHVPSLLSSSSTEINTSIPSGVFLWNACCILLYQTLDNMDGKQARRVGAASPLGLLFDHGCDAINSVFGSSNWITFMALTTGDMWLVWIVLFGPYGLFYVGTWEEYYTGQLIMPIVNGPSEGLLGAAAMNVLTFMYGTQFWQTYSGWEQLPPALISFLPPLRNADLLVLASTIGFVQEMGTKTIFVVRKYGMQTLPTLLPFILLSTLYLILMGLVLVDNAENSIWCQAPRTCLHLCAILFVDMTTDLMLHHTTHQPVRWQDRWLLVPLMVWAVGMATDTWPQEVVSHLDFLLLYTTAAGTYLCCKTVMIVHEICHVLNVWCFDIVTPRQQQQRISSIKKQT